MVVRKTMIVLLCLSAFALLSCSTANHPSITRVATGLNESAEPAATSFDISDGIFVVAATTNTTADHHVFFSVTAEKVIQRDIGSEVMTKWVDMGGKDPARLHFSVAWPGDYKVTATLSDKAGKELDSKSAAFTVTGEPPPLEEEHEFEGSRDADKEKGRDHDREKERGKKGKERDKD